MQECDFPKTVLTLRNGLYEYTLSSFGLTNASTYLIEGPEKATRGGVNGSQTKFLDGMWLISQNQPYAPRF
jgi:hypothetical protein